MSDNRLILEGRSGSITFRNITRKDDFASAIASLSHERGFETVMSTVVMMHEGLEGEAIAEKLGSMSEDQFDEYMSELVVTPLPDPESYTLTFTLVNGVEFEVEPVPMENTFGGLLSLIYRLCTMKAARSVMGIADYEFESMFVSD